MSDIKYEIIKKVGVLSKSASALSRVEGSEWAKEFNLISWTPTQPPPNTTWEL